MPLWYPKGLSKISLILCLVCAGIVQVIIHYVFDAYHIRMIVQVVMHYVFYAYHVPLSSICHILVPHTMDSPLNLCYIDPSSHCLRT